MDGLGSRWETAGLLYKAYPANHFTHTAVDAALTVRARGVDVDEIERVRLAVATPTLRTIAEPREEKVRPRSGYHAQFSGPFVVATALTGGGGLGVYLDDFTDERARDPRLLALAERVDCVSDPECDARYPQALPAILSVQLRSGETVVARALDDRRLTRDEVSEKFGLNARRAVAAPLADAIRLRIERLHDTDDLRTLWEGLCASTTP